jgi:hypothetical protein
LSAQIRHRSSPSGLKARQRRPFKCRRQRCNDERENGMAAKTNRARADGAALKPSKLFEGARPGPFRPCGKGELADSHQLRSRSQSSPQLRVGGACVKSRESLEFRTGTVRDQQLTSIIIFHRCLWSTPHIGSFARVYVRSTHCKPVLDLNFTQHHNCAFTRQTRIMRKTLRRSVSNSGASPSQTGRRL